MREARSPRSLRTTQAQQDAISFGGLSLAVNTVMAGFKMVVGFMSGSHALIASALYSVNDVLTSIAVSVSLRVAGRKATEGYPYGYSKAEYIAAGMVSLIIAIGVVLMFFFSVVDIIRGVDGPPMSIALPLAVVSMVTSWVLARRAHHLVRSLGSPILQTSAEHHHADAEGSLLAIIGIVGALMGFHALDRVIAVIETLHLIALSGKLLARSMKGLMDMALPQEDVELVEQVCAEVPGVDQVAHVWSRQAGGENWVDVAVVVGADLSVAHASGVCRDVETAVSTALGDGVVTQVRFQGPEYAYLRPGPGGSEH